MIFLKKSQNTIWIPKHNSFVGPFKLVLTHNLTQKIFEYPELTDEGMNSGYYIFLGLDFTGLESGENTYALYDSDGNLCENGLLQVMVELSEPISISYKKDRNKIIYNK